MTTAAVPPSGSRASARSRCDRVPGYASEWTAITAATTLRWTSRLCRRPSRCPRCQHWHLTSLETR